MKTPAVPTSRAIGRVRTAVAVVFVIAAQALVVRVPMAVWSRSLGSPGPSRRGTGGHRDRPAKRPPRWIATHVDRAADRLAWPVLCLPRAIACQWLLRLHGEAAELVIARRRGAGGPASQAPALHAWVECGGAQVIGFCDPHDHVEIMRWRSDAPVPRRRAHGVERTG